MIRYIPDEEQGGVIQKQVRVTYMLQNGDVLFGGFVNRHCENAQRNETAHKEARMSHLCILVQHGSSIREM